MITGFVFVMMLVIDYLNVLTAGGADKMLRNWKWGQSLLASFLGATPGCLGAYAVCSLYMHRIVTFGALSATMVATCGDEAFLMLSLFPRKAMLIFLILFVLGVATGILVDFFLKNKLTSTGRHLEQYRSHHGGERCVPFSREEFVSQWKNCTPYRGILALVLALFILGISTGSVGHQHLGVDTQVNVECSEHEHHSDWDWVKTTLLLASLTALFMVATVPDHFLEEHFWHHLVKIHLWRIFLWVFGTMIIAGLLLKFVDIQKLVSGHALPLLLLACLIGLIPQSGPHVIFVTLYASGSIPFAVLLANSIVQDGHGLAPILSHSRKAFIAVKAGKFLLGMTVGLLAYFAD